MTPATSDYIPVNKEGKNEVGDGIMNYGSMKKTNERDAFLAKQMKGGHFKEFNKLFKQEEMGGMPGLVGNAVSAGKVKRGKSKVPKPYYAEDTT